jgi:glycosyltransferase involved in cell wall biosynthesis
VRYGDVDGLKNKIIHVLNNPDEAKKKVLQGQRYIYENLTWDKIVTKVEEVYEDCIRNV